AADVVRQEIGGPDDRGQAAGDLGNLERAVIVAGAAALVGPNQTPRLIVKSDDRLAQRDAVDESHDARAGLEPCVGDEAGDEARMQRADVADGRPDLAWLRARFDFGSDSPHRSFPAMIGFEPVAFRVEDESRVIMRPIVLAHARLAVVA